MRYLAVILFFVFGFVNPMQAQLKLKEKAGKLVKNKVEEKKDEPMNTKASSSRTYITGSSAGDNKLKSFENKMDALEIQLVNYELFLNSDTKYDLKLNAFSLQGEGESLIVVNKFIETDIEAAATELKNGKKYAPDYGFEQEMKRYDDFVLKYNTLKNGSHNQALAYNQSRKDVEYEASYDNMTNKALKAELFKEKSEDPIYSDMHRNNKGKIVFHTSEVDRSNPTGKFEGTFNAPDRLYARAFFEKGFTNLTMTNSKGDTTRYAQNGVVFPYTLIYIDGKLQDYKYDNSSLIEADVLKNNTRQIWLYPSVSDGLTDIKWIKSVDKLSAGNHQVKLEYWIEEPTENDTYKAKIAEGDFTLVKKAGDKLKIGKSWSNFKTAMSNSTYESKILYVAQQISKLEDGLVAKAVKIVSSDWTIVKNNTTGAILYRYLVVQVKFTNPEGYCYTAPREAKQDYSGNGNYTSEFTLVTHYNKNIGFNGYIDCD